MAVNQIGALTTFTANTVIQSAQVNQNYADIKAAFNALVTGTDTLASGLTLPNGTLVGAGGSASAARPATVLYQNQGLTTSFTEVSLASFSLPAATLSADGKALRLTVVGRKIISDPGTVAIKFGATYLESLSVSSDDVFRVEAVLTRTGASTQRAVATSMRALASAPTTVNLKVSRTTPAETLSGAVVIDFRGAGNGSALDLDYVMVELLEA